MSTYIVGADLGNDSCKVAFSATTCLKLKNVVARRMTEENRKNITTNGLTNNGLLDDLDVIIRSKSINGRFFVGHLAARNGEIEVQTGTHKADNPHLIVPLITLLGLQARDFEKEVCFRMVCGLPIEEFTADRERFRDKLIGEYQVGYLSQGGRSIKVIIEDVLVAPEGVAVIMNQMMSDDGMSFRNPSLREGCFGVIDIGAFTTDIPIIVNGKPDSDASMGLAEGIANYLDKIVEHINQTYRVNMTRSQLVQRLETDKLALPIKGRAIDLKPYVDEQFGMFANKIVAIVDKIWTRYYQVQEFFVVGGGAKSLQPLLEKEMDNRGIKLTFLQDEDPQMQNALGYLKLAKRTFGVTAR